jgi:hypothetical protein
MELFGSAKRVTDDSGGASSGRAARKTPARRAPLEGAEPDGSQAAVLREFGWTLAGCAAVVVAVKLAAALLSHH